MQEVIAGIDNCIQLKKYIKKVTSFKIKIAMHFCIVDRKNIGAIYVRFDFMFITF